MYMSSLTYSEMQSGVQFTMHCCAVIGQFRPPPPGSSPYDSSADGMLTLELYQYYLSDTKLYQYLFK